MSAVGLIPLASLMIDMMVLGQFLPARASEVNPPAAAVDQKIPAKSAEAPRATGKAVTAHKQPVAAIESAEKENAAAEPPASIMKMLEGRERELLAAMAIAAAFFAIGWILGGNYYLRRDRRRRTKLRF